MLYAKACFPNAFPSHASNVCEITVTFLPHQQSFMALELPVTAGEILRSSFYFSKEFGNRQCCV